LTSVGFGTEAFAVYVVDILFNCGEWLCVVYQKETLQTDHDARVRLALAFASDVTTRFIPNEYRITKTVEMRASSGITLHWFIHYYIGTLQQRFHIR
jgi:hypothetical protein